MTVQISFCWKLQKYTALATIPHLDSRTQPQPLSRDQNYFLLTSILTSGHTGPLDHTNQLKLNQGNCKAEFQPRTVRGCASRGTVQNMKKWVSFFSIQPTIGRVSTPRRASRSSIPSPWSPTTFTTTTTGTGGSRTRAMYVINYIYVMLL